MSERKLDADMHYQQAFEAMNREARYEGDTPGARERLRREVDCRMALAHVSAIREQTEVLSRIQEALERRNVPLAKYIETWQGWRIDHVNKLLAQGWEIIKGPGPGCSFYDLGRPSNAEGGGEDG